MNAKERELFASMQAELQAVKDQLATKSSTNRVTRSVTSDPLSLDLIRIAADRGIHNASGCVAGIMYDTYMRIVRTEATRIAEQLFRDHGKDANYATATASLAIPQLDIVVHAYAKSTRVCNYAIYTSKGGVLVSPQASKATSDRLSTLAIAYQENLRAIEAKKLADASKRKQSRKNSDASITSTTKRTAIKRTAKVVNAPDSVEPIVSDAATESVAE